MVLFQQFFLLGFARIKSDFSAILVHQSESSGIVFYVNSNCKVCVKLSLKDERPERIEDKYFIQDYVLEITFVFALLLVIGNKHPLDGSAFGWLTFEPLTRG